MNPTETILNGVRGLKRKIFKKHPVLEEQILKKEIKDFDALEKIVNNYIKKITNEFRGIVEFALEEQESKYYQGILNSFTNMLKKFKNEYCEDFLDLAIVGSKSLSRSDDLVKIDFTIYKKTAPKIPDEQEIRLNHFVPDLIHKHYLKDELLYTACYLNCQNELDSIKLEPQYQPLIKYKQKSFEWISSTYKIETFYQDLRENNLISEDTKLSDLEYIFGKNELTNKSPKVIWTASPSLLAYLLSKLRPKDKENFFGVNIIRKYTNWSKTAEYCILKDGMNIKNLRQLKNQYESQKKIKDSEKFGKPEEHEIIDKFLPK